MGGKKRKTQGKQLENPHSKFFKTQSKLKIPANEVPNEATTSSDTIISQFSTLAKELDQASKLVNKPQNIEFPPTIGVWSFANARVVELASIMKDIQRNKPKQTLQQLPIHMRRKSASHHVKRVPRRLREKAAREINKAKQNKRPSRKHRRRPSNLLLEYERRARKNVWMETHIWFAKRFKLEKLWGYYLPIHPTDKSERASYKSTKHYAVLQDLSYMCCLELCGPTSALLEKLSGITVKSIGMTFAAKSLESGKREGSTVLYHPGCFPFQAIGPVSFLWQPLSDTSHEVSDIRKLWLWCHPSIYHELLKVLKSIFKMGDQEMSTSSENILDRKFVNRFKKTPSFTGEENIRLTSLKDNLVRHRLVGPRSQAIVGEVLKMADLSSSTDGKWWTKYFSNEFSRDVFNEQDKFWARIKAAYSPSELPSKLVIGLTVKDPRLNLPPKRQLIDNRSDDDNSHDPKVLECIPDMLAMSAIWDEDIRNTVTATKQPDSKLNQLRSELLVPGSILELADEESRVPVILIQQPDVEGYGSGWDLIAPLGWSMPFWISFIYNGARAFGLRELRVLARDMGQTLPPLNFPDTCAGETWQEENRLKMMQKYLRYPPAKRPSFKKMGVPNPFFMPWKQLVAELTKSTSEDGFSDIYVLRTKKILQKLNEICGQILRLSKQKFRNSHKDKDLAVRSINDIKQICDESNYKQSLVCLKFKSLSRGTIKSNSGVYSLDSADYTILQNSLEFKGPVEHIHKQDKVIKTKKKTDESKKDIEERTKKPLIKNLASHCSRKLIGYIECGGYSHTIGCACGIGHCSLLALVEVLESCLKYHLPPTVLVRSQNSLQYRVALFNVNLLL